MPLGTVLALLAAGANLVGAYGVVTYAPRSRRLLMYTIALSGGFMVTWTLIELIPHIVREQPQLISCVLAGYVGLYVVENSFASYAHRAGGEAAHGHALLDTVPGHEAGISRVGGWAALIGLVLHAFFDGAGIGASVLVSPRMGVLVFLAVLLHKIPEGSSASSIMLATGQTPRRALAASWWVALATVGGAFLVQWLSAAGRTVVEPLLALAGGTFLFVGASNLLPATQKGEFRTTVLVVLLGVALFYVAHVGLERLGIQ